MGLRDDMFKSDMIEGEKLTSQKFNRVFGDKVKRNVRCHICSTARSTLCKKEGLTLWKTIVTNSGEATQRQAEHKPTNEMLIERFVICEVSIQS